MLASSGLPGTKVFRPSNVVAEVISTVAACHRRIRLSIVTNPAHSNASFPICEPTIRPIEQNAPRFVSSLKHGQLVAQRDDFCLHCKLGREAREKGIEQH